MRPSINYNEDMYLAFYSNGEIEIAEGESPDIKWYFTFNNKSQLANLLKSNPKLLAELKELI